MGQTRTVGSHRTSVFTENGMTKVVYHQTAVVQWNQDTITLNSGGWKTNTTKARMNQASNQYNLGYQVYQCKGKWFVDYDGQVLDFADGMIIARIGGKNTK